MKKCAVVTGMLLAMVLGSTAVADTTVGAGYQAMFLGEFFQGASLRAWMNDKWLLEGNISQSSLDADLERDGDRISGDADLWLLSGKVAYAPIVRENSRFYIGVELGYGKADFDIAHTAYDGDMDMFTVGPMFGVEYRFTELPELGFNWEVGYRFTNVDGDIGEADLDADIDGIVISLGVHYYFN